MTENKDVHVIETSVTPPSPKGRSQQINHNVADRPHGDTLLIFKPEMLSVGLGLFAGELARLPTTSKRRGPATSMISSPILLPGVT